MQFFSVFKKHPGQVVPRNVCTFDVKSTPLINHLIPSWNVFPRTAVKHDWRTILTYFPGTWIHTNFVSELLPLIGCICLFLSDCEVDTSQSGGCNGQNVDSFCKTSGEGKVFPLLNLNYERWGCSKKKKNNHTAYNLCSQTCWLIARPSQVTLCSHLLAVNFQQGQLDRGNLMRSSILF